MEDQIELLITKSRKIIHVIDDNVETLKNIHEALISLHKEINNAIDETQPRGKKIIEFDESPLEKRLKIMRDCIEAAIKSQYTYRIQALVKVGLRALKV